MLAALMLAALTGCSTWSAGAPALTSLDPDRTEIEFRFNDSSVPPEYHRSYTLTAMAGQARIVVDSYGDILHDETAPVDEGTWGALLQSAGALQFSSSGDSDECAGGTSRKLLISQGDDPVLDVQLAVCGTDGQSQAEAIDAFVAPLLELFDMETLLAPSD